MARDGIGMVGVGFVGLVVWCDGLVVWCGGWWRGGCRGGRMLKGGKGERGWIRLGEELGDFVK